MPGNDIASLWARVVEHAGKPFLTDKGRELFYEVDGDAVLPSRIDRRPVPREAFERALAAMPCEDASKLPLERGCGYSRVVLFTILVDTRIWLRERFEEYQKNEYWERRRL